ncbi:MAG: hypothetical protein U0325_23400 [Polyangiales bacterium]
MRWLRDKLFSLGAFLCLAAVISAVAQLFHAELRIFRPLAEMDPGAAWGIRGGVFVTGLVLAFVLGKPADEGTAEAAATAPAQEGWAGYREAFLRHAGGQHFLQEVQAQVPPPGRVVHAVAMDAQGGVVPVDAPQAAFLVAYIDGGHERYQVSRAVTGGALQKAALSSLTWSAVVPPT